MTIAPDGGPTMVLFVAHWCPHCQREVPVVQDWVDGGGLPRGVDLVTVSTVIDPRRPDYPPDEWLAGEGWTAPVLVDADNTAAAAAGLSAYPFFFAVDGDGTVALRASGELTPDELDAIAAEIAGTTGASGRNITPPLGPRVPGGGPLASSPRAEIGPHTGQGETSGAR